MNCIRLESQLTWITTAALEAMNIFVDENQQDSLSTSMTTNRLLHLEKNMYLKFFVPSIICLQGEQDIYCFSHSGYKYIVCPMPNSPTFCSKNHELVPLATVNDDFYLPFKCFEEMMEKTHTF